MRWKIRLMTRPDMMSNVHVIFLEANSYEEARKMVQLEANQVATFEVLEEELNGSVVNDRKNGEQDTKPEKP